MIFLRGGQQLVTMRGPALRRGSQLMELGVINDGSVLIKDGRIDEVGSTRRVENIAKPRSAKVIDVAGKIMIPGFVDSGTRLLFGPPSLEAFEAQASEVFRLGRGEAAIGGKASNAPAPVAGRTQQPRMARRRSRAGPAITAPGNTKPRLCARPAHWMTILLRAPWR